MQVVWFKRDLRVEDHAPLTQAARQGPVLPLYVVEPEYWRLPDTSGRQWDFTRECLEHLRRSLANLGAPLCVRVGDVLDILAEIQALTPITALHSHEETGNAWTFQRDKAVGSWARGNGIPWTEYPHSGVVRRLRTRDNWAAQRDAVMRQPALEAPRSITGFRLPSDPLPTAKQLEMAPDPCPDRQQGGRDQALSLLGGFLTQRGQPYRKAMSSPLDGEWACSRLSPHFALGTVTIREAVHAAAARQAEVKGTRDGWIGSLRSFQSRLAWRDHFMQKLEDEPSLEERPLHSAYIGLRGDDPAKRRAWEQGETGIPFVDACMRYVIHTGWLNFRMRSMLMAVASYHLWLDWRLTGAHLARMFTDYEPGIHWSQTQMQSGTTGMNTIRIYNPIKQGRDQDPEGVFTRRWVPELADVPDKFLQEPWKWDGAGALRYPPPIVDVVEAARFARERIWAVRRGEDFRSEAAKVIEKHASRKDRRFVNDRSPRKRAAKPGDDRQMKLDL